MKEFLGFMFAMSVAVGLELCHKEYVSRQEQANAERRVFDHQCKELRHDALECRALWIQLER